MHRALWAFVLAGCSRNSPTLAAVDSGAPTTAAPISVRPGVPDAALPSDATICGPTVQAAQGDSFEKLSRRCYGSRTYQDWLVSHNHHEARMLRAGEQVDTPPFEVLLDEHLSPKYKGEIAAGIRDAFSRFRSVQDELEAQSRKESGAGSYHPSARAKEALTAAASALRPVVTRLEAAGARNQQLARALRQLEALSTGAGTFSLDYETEEVHQHFRFAVDALR